MEELKISHPGEENLVIGVLTLHQQGNLVFAIVLQWPAVSASHGFYDLKRIVPKNFAHVFDNGQASPRAKRRLDHQSAPAIVKVNSSCDASRARDRGGSMSLWGYYLRADCSMRVILRVGGAHSV